MLEQCKGITKNGTQCKISRNLVDGYCHLHLNQSENKREVKENIADSLNESSESIKPQNLQTAQREFEPKFHQDIVRQEAMKKPEHRFLLTAIFFIVLALICSSVLKRK